MSTFTPNLNLEKPDGTDYVNIGALNSNMDKIDAKVPNDMADYPIEERIIPASVGGNYSWHCTRWKSGKKEAKVKFNLVSSSYDTVAGLRAYYCSVYLPYNFFTNKENMLAFAEHFSAGSITLNGSVRKDSEASVLTYFLSTASGSANFEHSLYVVEE